jgi:hypothetical protein
MTVAKDGFVDGFLIWLICWIPWSLLGEEDKMAGYVLRKVRNLSLDFIGTLPPMDHPIIAKAVETLQ